MSYIKLLKPLKPNEELKMTEKHLTKEMVLVARQLREAADKYLELYHEVYGKKPVIWINYDDGETIFISESFNAERIKGFISIGGEVSK